MITNSAQILACPVDGLPLEASGKSLVCKRKHNYDVAKNGYCNLLLVQQKGSLDPGDSNEMVGARRRFLNAGHYSPIADRIYTVTSDFPNGTPQRINQIVDAGCGEGYYLERFAALAKENGTQSEFALTGMDVSKWAVKSAAARNIQALWLVASNRQPPFLPASVDMILCIFGFPHWNGFSQVLAKNGRILLADPGPDHLIELRRTIYETVRSSPPPALDDAQKAGFYLETEELVRYKVDLHDSQAIHDLLMMTPYGVRMAPERASEIAAVEKLEITVEVSLRLLSKARKTTS